MFIQTTPIELPDYKFPYWSHVAGQIITAATLSGVIFWALALFVDALFFHKKVKFDNRLINRFRFYISIFKQKPLITLIKPDFDKWKPRKEEHQKLMREVHGFETTSRFYILTGQDNLAMSSTSFKF